jgi:hypothetical protein
MFRDWMEAALMLAAVVGIWGVLLAVFVSGALVVSKLME